MQLLLHATSAQGRARPAARGAAGASRQAAARASKGESSDSDLSSRIASGQYSVKGSKKERIVRPARKLLSKDPVGPGAEPRFL